jgi:hypothetical protein
MAPPRRFKAPAGTGEVLADPGFDRVPELVERNRTLLDRADVKIGGLSLRDLRALARREVLELAQQYTESPPVATGGLTPDAPLLLAGHQPELSHPGVWVKHFALNGLARKVGGTPLNLVVDNDTLKSPSLRFPVFRDRDPQAVHALSVPFDKLDGETYEDRSVFDPELFRTFADRAAPLWANWGYEPALRWAWEYVTRWGDLRTNIGDLFAAVRRRFEYGWGCHNLELPVSRLSGTEAFRRFAGHIFNDLPRFREVYNTAIRAFREANGIRSANHPAPELADDEAPFWIRATLVRRERATATSDVRKLRPRALTLTLFARLCLGDFFIHGIGGGKYDEVTDAIIRDYFGLEPPAYQVLSATLHLPLPAFPDAEAKVQALTRYLRHAHWNPQRRIPGSASDRPDVRALLARHQELVEHEPADSAGRRERFREFRRIADQLRPLNAAAVATAEAMLARARTEAHANAILRRRDYSWVLFPEDVLRPFLQRFLDV